MTTISQCYLCQHLRKMRPNSQWTCEAFPNGIAPEIVLNRVSHKVAIEGDGGVRFAPQTEGEIGKLNELFGNAPTLMR